MTVFVLLIGLSSGAGCVVTGKAEKGFAAPRAGTDTYRLETRRMTSSSGCRFDYRLYRPIELDGPPSKLVVIGHGFLRHQDTMTGLARSLANNGIPSLTLQFCSMRPWNGNHRMNARDMVAVVDRIGATDVVYTGFSAGALAAVLAAAADARARAVVTLDLVDQNELGKTALRDLDTPLVGYVGEPSRCNRQGAAAMLVTGAPQGLLEMFENADHCDFEAPSDWLCRRLCGNGQPDSSSTRQRIIERATRRVRSFFEPATGTHRTHGSTARKHIEMTGS